MVDLRLQRRLAADLLKCAPERIRFNTEKLAEIKEAITKADVKGMINSGDIQQKPQQGNSRGRARAVMKQKKKGLRKGLGSRKGTANARTNKKDTWMAKIRKQRALLKALREKKLLTSPIYQNLCNKSKGGYFRSERHLKLYIHENKLIQEK